MAIKGIVILEELSIYFELLESNIVQYTITDSFTGKKEEKEAPSYDFFATLAIAVHHEGKPEPKDFEIAEKIQGEIRWIP